MEEKIYIFGHKNPDTDSICASLVSERLDKRNGWNNTVAKRLGKVNKETQYVLDYLKIEAPEMIDKVEEGQEVCLVDHNEFNQSVEGIEKAKILSVTDHHRIANFETSEPLYYTAKPYGCTCTILFEEYKRLGHEINKEEAILMTSAIISDTLLLKSPTTTENDKKALTELEKIAGINLQEYGLEMLKAGTDLGDFSEAELVNAEKNLSYTNVISPADGVIGKIPYRVGALVNSAITTPLTTVSDISQMYVYFSMTEKELLDLVRQDSTPGKIIEKMPEVSLVTADGRPYEEKGKITTISEVIDQATGSVRARATFANPQRLLRSGGNGMVIIPTTLNDVIVVPQKSTYELQDKRFVYVLNNESKAESREVKVYNLDDGKNFVIMSGLQPGERIVMEGVSTLRNGTQINPITEQEAQAKLNAVTGAAQQQK